MKTAQESRLEAENNNKKLVKARIEMQLDIIKSCIESVVFEGGFQCSFSLKENFYKENKAFLFSLGYEVICLETKESINQFDYIIKW